MVNIKVEDVCIYCFLLVGALLILYNIYRTENFWHDKETIQVTIISDDGNNVKTERVSIDPNNEVDSLINKINNDKSFDKDIVGLIYDNRKLSPSKKINKYGIKDGANIYISSFKKRDEPLGIIGGIGQMFGFGGGEKETERPNDICHKNTKRSLCKASAGNCIFVESTKKCIDPADLTSNNCSDFNDEENDCKKMGEDKCTWMSSSGNCSPVPKKQLKVSDFTGGIKEMAKKAVGAGAGTCKSYPPGPETCDNKMGTGPDGYSGKCATTEGSALWKLVGGPGGPKCRMRPSNNCGDNTARYTCEPSDFPEEKYGDIVNKCVWLNNKCNNHADLECSDYTEDESKQCDLNTKCKWRGEAYGGCVVR